MLFLVRTPRCSARTIYALPLTGTSHATAQISGNAFTDHVIDALALSGSAPGGRRHSPRYRPVLDTPSRSGRKTSAGFSSDHLASVFLGLLEAQLASCTFPLHQDVLPHVRRRGCTRLGGYGFVVHDVPVLLWFTKNCSIIYPGIVLVEATKKTKRFQDPATTLSIAACLQHYLRIIDHYYDFARD